MTTGDYSKIPRGKYRHYKQKEYELIDIVHHSETQEPLVLYRTLYGNFDLWVRPFAMFFESVEIEGEKIARFEYIGE
tara:strand:- start:1881 stop:2111 length:231 start_codon:yes stop_codon:yes gene_type:complete